jgi:hypothetical protein
MDTDHVKFRPAAKLPYEILSARSDGCLAAFATFDLALAYYRGYVEAIGRCFTRPALPRVVNTDRRDGSEDGNDSGLSDEEREALEAIG